MRLFRAILLLFAAAMVSSVLAQTTQDRHFDIPRQKLDSALAALARQADLQLIYPAQLVQDKTSPTLSGTMTADVALGRLLGPSGLRHEFVDAHTVTISAGRVEQSDSPATSKNAVAPAEAGPASPRKEAAPQPSLPSVTVIAPPLPDPRDLQGHSVPDFITLHGRGEVLTGTLARWDVGVCPRTVGLQPELNSYVSDRIEALATHIGLEAQDTVECGRDKLRGELALDPNVLIIFTRQPQKLMDDIAAHHYELLGFHYPNQTKKLKTVNRPIQAWYVTATRGAGGAEWVDSIFDSVPPGVIGTRLATGQQSLFVYVLIVADVDKIQGYTIGSLADYIAVLTLSQVRSLDGCGRLASIIDLMSPGCRNDLKPDSITASDVAYLKGLYHVGQGLTQFLQISGIETQMMRQLLPH
jgi:hypothetical protein